MVESYTTKEIPPTDEELQKIKSEKLSVFTPFIDIASAIKDMPRVMWILALVYLFQWYALFCYWQNSSKVVAKNSFEWRLMTDKENEIKKSYSEFKETLNKNNLYKSSTDSISKINNSNSTSSYATIYATWKDKIDYPKKLSEEETKTLSFIEANDKKYEKAVSWTGLINGWYNIVTFLVAFSLVWMARKYSAKIVHMSCLLIAGFGFIAFTFIENKYLFFPAITGFGIGWASMMGIPYLMVVSDIPKERYGVYMGIINMMIVIPMFIQTITFGYIMKHFFNNDSNKAILFAGILLLISAVCTLFMKTKKSVSE